MSTENFKDQFKAEWTPEVEKELLQKIVANPADQNTPAAQFKPAENLEVRVQQWVVWLSGQTFSGSHVQGEIMTSLQKLIEKEFEMAAARNVAPSLEEQARAYHESHLPGNVAPSEPLAWTILQPGGVDVFFGEDCIFGDEVSARDRVEGLNDEIAEDAPQYEILPLYRLAANPVPVAPCECDLSVNHLCEKHAMERAKHLGLKTGLDDGPPDSICMCGNNRGLACPIHRVPVAPTAEQLEKLEKLAQRWEWAANLGQPTTRSIRAQQTGWKQCAAELRAELRAALRAEEPGKVSEP